MNRRFRGALAAVALLLPLGLGACEANPATGRQSFTAFMSPQEEIRVGREEHPKIVREFGGEIDDAKLKAYVSAIGQRLAKTSEMPDLQFTFTVLNSDITNAFALPGGYVYVTRGLLSLASTEAEIAGVIGHEIGHVTGRHTAERYSRAAAVGIGATIVGVAEAILLGTNVIGQVGQQVGGLYLASYSRDQEFEADTLGVTYLARGGYDTTAMSSFLAKLQAESQLNAELAGQQGASELNIMSTHPRTQDRVQAATEQAKQQAGAPAAPRVGRDEYLNAIDGMAYGGDRENGFVKNRTFVHPLLRLQFEVPQGFTLFNSDRAVVARGPNNARIVFDRDTRAQASGMSMARYLQAVRANDPRLTALETLEISGLEAATAATSVNTNSGTMDLRLVAIRFDPRTIYRFVFASPRATTASLNEAFRRVTYSFRKLSESEAASVKPLRIRVVTAGPGDTIDSLARRMAFDSAQAARLRILNGLADGQAIQPGQRIKIVTE